MNTSYEVKNLDKITHSIRANQLIYQFGVGAMINFPIRYLCVRHQSIGKRMLHKFMISD